jgi:hypothetical protein
MFKKISIEIGCVQHMMILEISSGFITEYSWGRFPNFLNVLMVQIFLNMKELRWLYDCKSLFKCHVI